MSGLVKAIYESVCRCCHASKIRKKGCAVSMHGVPASYVIVDFDCDALSIPSGSRCDYLFVGEYNDSAWVAPIELKGGNFRGGLVAEQLQGGADVADKWLPRGSPFRFVPVLAHGKGVHRTDLKILRNTKIKLRNHTRQTALIHCSEPLRKALRNPEKS